MATYGNGDNVPPAGRGDLPVLDLRTMKELCQPTWNGRGGPIAPIAIQAMNLTKLRNEITNFRQRPDESLFEAWERYKLSIDRCPNHNMLPVIQIDTFYNGLPLRHRDTINVAAGGTFMKRRPEECYDLIENMTAHHNDWDTFAQRTTVGQTQNVYAAGAFNQGDNSYQPQGNRNLLSYRSDNYLRPPGFNQNQNRSNPNQNYQNKNQENNHGNPQGNNQGRNQFFQGQNPPLVYQAPAYQALGYQALVQQAPISQPQVVPTNEFTNYMKANDAILKNMQTNMTSLLEDSRGTIEKFVTLISTLDISDSMHLHPNDCTAPTVVSIKLRGTKIYQVWSCAMLLDLEENKTGFIDGSCKRYNTYEHNQLMKLMQFLMGLDDSYMQIRSYILSKEVLPDVRSTYATISSEESHRVASGSIILKSSVILLILEKKKSGQNFKRKGVSNNNSVGSSSSSGFTDEQMATLISLNKYNKIGKSVQGNMAGANQHITYTDKESDNVLNISHLKIKVGHPNETKAFISKIGNLKLSNGLVLYDVLVLPKYPVTLISIHKLSKENKIIVAYDESRCYFLNQDFNLRNVLGIGNQCGGLYYYNNQEPVLNVLKDSL
nr:ribonuclease H-like domain-containing protein [Tanacetum cinerariifolium]